MSTQPEFIYAALVLPSLFALSLISEGVSKLLKHQPAWVSLLTGSFFLSVVLITYFLILRK